LTAETGKVAEPAVFTTREILRIEYDMAQSANVPVEASGFRCLGSEGRRADRQGRDRDPEKPFKLDPSRSTPSGTSPATVRFAVVSSVWQGAGKSTLLAAARVAWEGEGHRVFGAALAGKAAEGLEDSSGIKSRTLASWELAWENGRDLLERGDVFVIDEAGMVLLATDGACVEGRSRTLARRRFWSATPCSFSRSRRVRRSGRSSSASGLPNLPVSSPAQQEAWARDASRLFARGKVEEGLDAYAQQGRIVPKPKHARSRRADRRGLDRCSARASFRIPPIEEMRRLRGDELLVLAHTNEDVKRLNESLRKRDDGGGRADRTARKFQTERGSGVCRRRPHHLPRKCPLRRTKRARASRSAICEERHARNGRFDTATSAAERC
jgi:hypothetical protein